MARTGSRKTGGDGGLSERERSERLRATTTLVSTDGNGVTADWDRDLETCEILPAPQARKPVEAARDTDRDVSLGRAFTMFVGAAAEAAAPILVERLRPAMKAVICEVLDERHGTLADGITPAAPAYVSLKDAGRFMGAHPKTVRKLIAAGKLGRFHLEGKPRVKVADIHVYLSRRSEAPVDLSLDERARRILVDASDK